jgi:D-inositol-3-phosphate glycosyltransferase
LRKALLKILIISEYYYPKVGGVEAALKELAERMASLGHEVTILTIKLPETCDTEELGGVKIRRVTVPHKGDRYYFNSFSAIRMSLKIGAQCDIIHAGCEESAFIAWLTAKLLKKPSVVTIHEPLGSSWRSIPAMTSISKIFLRRIEAILLSLSFNKYICISQSTKKRFLKINKSISEINLTVIYWGIDELLFNTKMANRNTIREKLHIDDEFVYLYFGRPGFSKGVEYLVNAVSQISLKIPRSKLLLILANSPLKPYQNIIEMIKQLDIQKNVILLEPVPRTELPNYIAASDCVVVPSISEGFGFTAAEACAMRKPVVATNVGSLPEIISGKYVLIEPKSSNAIALGVERVYLDNVEKRAVNQFSWLDCVQNYLQAYNESIMK